MTAVHAGTREELGDLLDGAPSEEEGYFVTGSADGVVRAGERGGWGGGGGGGRGGSGRAGR